MAEFEKTQTNTKMTEFEKTEDQPPTYEMLQQNGNPAQPQPQPNQHNMVYQVPPPVQVQPQSQQQAQVQQPVLQQLLVLQQPQLQQSQQNTQIPQAGTTVIINQPAPKPLRRLPRPWTSGICSGMCDDVQICLCGFFCGCCLTGSVATDMGESSCVPCCVPGAEIALRVKWRTQENIQGSILDDCLTVWCCGPCAMCQLAREVKAKRTGIYRQLVEAVEPYDP